MLKLKKEFTINGRTVIHRLSFCGVDVYVEQPSCEEVTIYLVKGNKVVQIIEVEANYAQSIGYTSAYIMQTRPWRGGESEHK